MTKNKKFKRLVRERKERTGESYQAALQALQRSSPEERQPSAKSKWRRRTVEDLNRVAASFGGEQTVKWTAVPKIVEVLNRIGEGAPHNHMFFPVSGGLDLVGARASNEPGCIELLAGSMVRIVRPLSLMLERFPEDRTGDWTYFRLELAPLVPVSAPQDQTSWREEIAEVGPGQYEDRSVLEEEECPPFARPVIRLLGGALVIFAKGSIYNQASGPYLGLHSLGPKGNPRGEVTSTEFREMIGLVAREGVSAWQFSIVMDGLLERQKALSRRHLFSHA